MRKRTGVIAILAMGLALGACKKKEPPPTPTPPPVQTRDTAAENAAARAAQARADSLARADAARRAAEAAVTEARNTLTEMVFFDYDMSDIRADMQDVLNRKAALLRANPSVTMSIDGHADERGTVEYNLALGERRAQAVERMREYLTGFGVDVSRLEVAGYGEEKPLDSGTTEDAYARNRRAEFQITRGGDNLVPAR